MEKLKWNTKESGYMFQIIYGVMKIMNVQIVGFVRNKNLKTSVKQTVSWIFFSTEDEVRTVFTPAINFYKQVFTI